MTQTHHQAHPDFSLGTLLKTVFVPIEGSRVAVLIDLEDPHDIKEFRFLQDDRYPVQHHAYYDFYQALHHGVMDELGLTGGDIFAYKMTGGSNLDLPDEAVTPAGETVSLERDVYPNYSLILAITSYSATAPLTAHAKKYGFRGSTMHGVNDVILSSGLCKDYNEVSVEAEKLRLGMTGADFFEIDFAVAGQDVTLKILTNGQEAQKSHGLCHGTDPDIANLPAGEVYFVPEGAEGQFPMKFEDDGTIAMMHVRDGRVVQADLIQGDQATVDRYNEKIKADPVTGEIGELGMGTQDLPFSDSDIQDEKIRGTVHVATGRSDHLGGHLKPELFAEAGNATHDDILFSPQKTPEIRISQVRMHRHGEDVVLMENFQTAPYMDALLETPVEKITA